MKLTCSLASLALAAAAVPTAACAQHLWYNDRGPGDLMLLDVNVQASALTTYFETLGWNQGGDAGGYTGLQTSGARQLAIFSMWDPISAADGKIEVVYQKPGTYTGRFGGEGAGVQYFDYGYGWRLGKTVTSAVRSWPQGNHTRFGMWMRNSATGVWTHHTTFDYPLPNVSFNWGATSFLENWTGALPQARRQALFGNGWKRSQGQWYPLDRATADSRGQFGVSNNAFFLVTGGLPAPVVNSVLATRAVGNAPVMDPVRVTSLSAIENYLGPYRARINVAWKTSETAGPQFRYTVQVIDGYGQTMKTVSEIAPHVREAAIDVDWMADAPGAKRVLLRLTNLLDQESPPTEAAVTGQAVAGRIYRIRSEKSGMPLSVPHGSPAAATGLVQSADQGKPWQEWLLAATPVAGEYKLVARHSGQCAGVTASSRSPGAQFIQYPCTGNPNQTFLLQRMWRNLYALKAKHSGMCVDVEGGSNADGARIVQQPCHWLENQQWSFDAR